MARKIDPRLKCVHQVANNYLFSSDALSIFRFHMTSEMYLKNFGVCLKVQQKEGILSVIPNSPPTPCHHSSSFGRPPPSPSSDYIIYEQSLTKMAFSSLSVRALLFCSAWKKKLRPLLIRNIINCKNCLRNQFWHMESVFLMRKSEKKGPKGAGAFHSASQSKEG